MYVECRTAIGILLDRPQEWSTDALTELRNKLAAAPQRFTEENLEKAHALHYHKELVDIISMIKRAADQEQPLFTASERVSIAFKKVTGGRTFTPEQQHWLERIRAHMINNLTLSEDDFQTMPDFTRAGGWGKANKVFEGKLSGLIGKFNKAIAA